jgi:hypothetical protein
VLAYLARYTHRVAISNSRLVGLDGRVQVGPLLEQIAGPVASFTGDGADDRDDVYREVCQRHPDAAVTGPPRLSAVPSATAETAPRSATGTCS